MIRINLLGTNTGKGKRGKRPGTPAIVIVPTDGPSPLLTGMLVFLVAAAASGWFYVRANHDHEELAKQMSSAQKEAESLRGVKQRFEKRKQEAEEYERRVKVIETLRLNQSGPVDMMSTMAETVNHTDAVWLSQVVESEKTPGELELDGTALSTTAVANLISNLMKTGYFKRVEIDKTFQDASVKDLSAFNFVLICQKAEAKSDAKTDAKADTKKS